MLRHPRKVLHLPARYLQRAQACHFRPLLHRSTPILYCVPHSARWSLHRPDLPRIVRIRERLVGNSMGSDLDRPLGSMDRFDHSRDNCVEGPEGRRGSEEGVRNGVGGVGEEDAIQTRSLCILTKVRACNCFNDHDVMLYEGNARKTKAQSWPTNQPRKRPCGMVSARSPWRAALEVWAPSSWASRLSHGHPQWHNPFYLRRCRSSQDATHHENSATMRERDKCREAQLPSTYRPLGPSTE